MDINHVISMVRAGNCELRPIIDYYARSQSEMDLIPFLNDVEVRDNLLYIIHELVSVDVLTWTAVDDLLKRGLTSPAALFARDIVENKRVRT